MSRVPIKEAIKTRLRTDLMADALKILKAHGAKAGIDALVSSLWLAWPGDYTLCRELEPLHLAEVKAAVQEWLVEDVESGKYLDASQRSSGCL